MSLESLFANSELQKGVLTPHDAVYQERQNSYWSSYSKTGPACIVRPTSAQEVSTIVKALVTANQQFAVRSGGHMQWYGANNVRNGVQIDLCFLNWTRLDKTEPAVDIGPGALWREVYVELEKHGYMVGGGRSGKVGVGGLLLGGGKTFFTGSRGFACDDILSYEIVLADGRIITVDADNYSDLFLVLKGGSGNFGIVTNFRMRAFEFGKIWGGFRILPKSSTQDALQALQDFTSNAAADVDSNLLLFLGHMGSSRVAYPFVVAANVLTRANSVLTLDKPGLEEDHVIAAMIQVGGVERAAAYQKYLDMPAVNDTSKFGTISETVSEYNPVPNGYYNCFFTLTLKNDVRIFQKASELHDLLVKDLLDFIPDGHFLTECLFQPLPKLFGHLSKKVGGNIMGVSDQAEDGVLFVAIAVVRTTEQEAFAYPKLQAWGRAVRDFAATFENGLLPWVYINYADETQDPLGSYGAGNVRKMKEAAAKYDPGQVFQKLCPGGFKITKVEL